MKLNKGTTIIDEQKFIKSHLSLIKNYGQDNKISKPYLDRLKKYCNLKGIELKSLINKK
jgi:hypothetical protein